MAEISIGVGREGRSLPDEVQGWVSEALARCAGITVQEIEDERDTIFARGMLSWPEDTGNSKEAFYKGLRLDPNLEWVEGFIGFDGRAPYIPYIKSKKVGGKSPLQVLIRLPMARARERLIAKLPEEFEDFTRQAQR